MTDFPDTEMEMRKLHMGTVSYGFESMDEVAHQLHVAFGSGDKGKVLASFTGFLTHRTSAAHKKQTSLMTGAQLATRGRRDMSSRVKDVVLSLALCHNVGFSLLVLNLILIVCL